MIELFYGVSVSSLVFEGRVLRAILLMKMILHLLVLCSIVCKVISVCGTRYEEVSSTNVLAPPLFDGKLNDLQELLEIASVTKRLQLTRDGIKLVCDLLNQ